MLLRHVLILCVLAPGLALYSDGDIRAQSPAPAEDAPVRIIMGGYAPASTSFSLALKQVGDRLQAKFGERVDVKYVYNILDLGYQARDILWLVESGVLTLGYQSSSYMTDRVPDLGIADLPFLFETGAEARAAMDGRFGELMSRAIESNMNFRIVGYFENGFRHISNRVRPVTTPADLKDISVRVLPSEILERSFELFGASPQVMDLSVALARIREGSIDAQENPFANTVTYGVHNFHKYHSVTGHLYLSRPIFINQPAFDSWPPELQSEIRAAFADAVAVQRQGHDREELEAAELIRATGGEILELTPEQLQPFRDAIAPIYDDARQRYRRELLDLLGL